MGGMLDNAAAVLMRLVAESGRELVDFAQKDVEPVNEGFIVGFSCGVRTRDDSIERVRLHDQVLVGRDRVDGRLLHR